MHDRYIYLEWRYWVQHRCLVGMTPDEWYQKDMELYDKLSPAMRDVAKEGNWGGVAEELCR